MALRVTATPVRSKLDSPKQLGSSRLADPRIEHVTHDIFNAAATKRISPRSTGPISPTYNDSASGRNMLQASLYDDVLESAAVDHAQSSTSTNVQINGKDDSASVAKPVVIHHPRPPAYDPRRSPMTVQGESGHMRSGLRSRSAPYRRIGPKLADTSASQLAEAYIGHLLPEGGTDKALEVGAELEMDDIRGSGCLSPIRTPSLRAIQPVMHLTHTKTSTALKSRAPGDAPGVPSMAMSPLRGSFPLQAAGDTRVSGESQSRTNSRQVRRAAASARLPTSHLKLRQEFDASRPPTRQRNAFPTFLSDAELIRDVRQATRAGVNQLLQQENAQPAERLPPMVEEDEDVDIVDVVQHLAQNTEHGGRRAEFYARELRLQRQYRARQAAYFDPAGGSALERAQVWQAPLSHAHTGPTTGRMYMLTPGSTSRLTSAAPMTHRPLFEGIDEDMASFATVNSREQERTPKDDLDRSGTAGSLNERLTAFSVSTSQNTQAPRTAELSGLDVPEDDGFEEIPVSVEVPIVVSGQSRASSPSDRFNSVLLLNAQSNGSVMTSEYSPPSGGLDRSAFVRSLLSESFVPSYNSAQYEDDVKAMLLRENAQPTSRHEVPIDGVVEDNVDTTDPLDMPDVEDDLYLEDTNLDEGFLSLFANGKTIVARSPSNGRINTNPMWDS